MDSKPIAQFLNETYPDPPVPLTSELAKEIEDQGRKAILPASRISIWPREPNILSPRAREHFLRRAESQLGQPLSETIDTEKEEAVWNAIDGKLESVGQMMLRNSDEGPFTMGALPSYVDFHITGILQCTRVIDEGVFRRFMKYPGFKDVYEACLPFMGKKD